MRIRLIVLLLIALSCAANASGLRGGVGRIPPAQVSGSYDYLIEFAPPDDAQWYPVSWLPGAVTAAGKTYYSITNGPGVLVGIHFLQNLSNAPRRGQADSAIALTPVSIVVDGDALFDRIPMQDLFGTAENSGLAESKWFGKDVAIRDSFAGPLFNAQSGWYLWLPMAWEDSIRITVYEPPYAMDAYDRPGTWLTAEGYITETYESRYKLHAFYNSDSLGRWDYSEVVSLTTDTTRTGKSGKISIVARCAYTDGASREPLPWRSVFTSTQGSMLEGAWIEYVGPAAYSKPLMTTLTEAVSIGDSVIKVNADLTKQDFGNRNNERCVILRHACTRSHLYRNGSGYNNIMTMNAADSTLTFKKSGLRSDTLMEFFDVGDEVAIFTFDSTQLADYQYALYAGWEESFKFGYYQGRSEGWLTGWPKRGLAYGTDPNLNHDSLNLAGADSEPHSMYRIYDPPATVSTLRGIPQCYRLYEANSTRWATEFYMRLRTVVYAYLEGAAGVQSQVPSYNWEADSDTFRLTKASQGYYVRVSHDTTGWPFLSTLQCKNGVTIAKGPSTNAAYFGADLNGILGYNYIASFHFMADSNSHDMPLFSPDSAFIRFVPEYVREAETDSFYFYMIRPSYMDSIKLDSASLVPWHLFGPWSGTGYDSTAIASIFAETAVIEHDTIMLKIRDWAVPYLWQRINNQIGAVIGVTDSCGWNRVVPDITWGTSGISTYGDPTYIAPELIFFGKKAVE